MNTVLVKQMLDACFSAKKITELMPQLPEKMKPRHIHVIDAVHELSEKEKIVTVGAVSEQLKVTMPSVTKLVNELESRQILVKNGVEADKRITAIKLTEKGEHYYQVYVAKYHAFIGNLLNEIEEGDVEVMIKTVEKIYGLMKENQMEEDR